MRSRSKEKSPAAAARGTSSVQRASRAEPGAGGERKRAAPRSAVRAKAKATKARKVTERTIEAVLAERFEPLTTTAPSLVRQPEPQEERKREGEAAPESFHAQGPTAYQQMYAEACSAGSDGRIALDTERFARALAASRVGVLAEQELYHLGVLAAAEGQESLGMDDVVAALAV